MLVHPDHRRLGLANWLFAWLLQKSKIKGLDKIELVCTEHELDMYRKFGFKEWQDDKLTMMRALIRR